MAVHAGSERLSTFDLETFDPSLGWRPSPECWLKTVPFDGVHGVQDLSEITRLNAAALRLAGASGKDRSCCSLRTMGAAITHSLLMPPSCTRNPRRRGILYSLSGNL